MMFAAFLTAMAVCMVGVMMTYRLETYAPPTRPGAAAGRRPAR